MIKEFNETDSIEYIQDNFKEYTTHALFIKHSSKGINFRMFCLSDDFIRLSPELAVHKTIDPNVLDYAITQHPSDAVVRYNRGLLLFTDKDVIKIKLDRKLLYRKDPAIINEVKAIMCSSPDNAYAMTQFRYTSDVFIADVPQGFFDEYPRNNCKCIDHVLYYTCGEFNYNHARHVVGALVTKEFVVIYNRGRVDELHFNGNKDDYDRFMYFQNFYAVHSTYNIK